MCSWQRTEDSSVSLCCGSTAKSDSLSDSFDSLLSLLFTRTMQEDYAGYDFENRLHVRIHSALASIRTAAQPWPLHLRENWKNGCFEKATTSIRALRLYCFNLFFIWAKWILKCVQYIHVGVLQKNSCKRSFTRLLLSCTIHWVFFIVYIVN